MEICRCENRNHDNHKDKNCEAPATESDGFCKECSDKAGEELSQTVQETNQPPR